MKLDLSQRGQFYFSIKPMVAKSWFGSMWKAHRKHDANSNKVV